MRLVDKTFGGGRGTAGDAGDPVGVAGRIRPRQQVDGGDQFDARAGTPVAQAQARLTRLVAMLRAYPAVNVRLIGFTNPSGDAAAVAPGNRP